MKDRNVQHASRFRLTKVPGTDDVYDLIPAPGEVYEEGTLINKSSLLKDATAALFGLGSDAVPDDALALLSRFHKGLGNEYVWAKSQYQEIKIAVYLSFPGTETSNILCANHVTIDSSGNISLSNPETYTFTQIANNNSIIKGKYVFYHPDSYHGDDKIKYVGETAGLGFSSGGHSFVLNVSSGGYIVSAQLELVSYVNSPYPDAYPPSVSDGYTYTALGQLGNKVQIEIGSYVGTGTYGSSNPNSLTFEFEPKLVIIGLRGVYINHYFWGESSMCGANSYSSALVVTVNDTTMNWYHSSDVSGQLNSTNTYHYIAIG